MKISFIFSFFCIIIPFITQAQLKVGENPQSINASAALEVESSNKGLLLPRMTTAQRDAISNPAEGLLIYNTTLKCLQINAGSTGLPDWVSVSNNSSITGIVLAEILEDSQSPGGALNANGLPVTAAQLQTLPLLGFVSGHTSAYQAAIRATTNFSNPPGIIQIQYIIDQVNNNVSPVLTQIGNEADNPNAVPSVVTVAQLNLLALAGVTAGNLSLYRTYIDDNPDQFSSPATIAEVQAMITAVNTAAPTSGGTALIASWTCNTASAGTLITNQVISGVSQTITANVTATGTYTITLPAVNGITFSANGVFNSTGLQPVTLIAAGTPAAVLTSTFTLPTTPNCSFNRTSTLGAILSSLNCATATVTGLLKSGQSAGGLTLSLPYTGGNGGAYPSQTITSSNNPNLNLVLAAGNVVSGNGSFTLSFSGTPSQNGPATFPVTIAGKSCTVTVLVGCGAYIAAGVWKEFMCHNLGANTSADPFTPSWQLSGNYYIWGRNPACFAKDGVDAANTCGTQKDGVAAPWGSTTTTDNAGAVTGWTTQNIPDGLWSDVIKTANDPCPAGYRVPTKTEWEGVINTSLNTRTMIGATWTAGTANYSNGIMHGTQLFLPAAGWRDAGNAQILERGSHGYYWSSTVNGTANQTWALRFFNTASAMINSYRDSPYPIRCIAQ